MFGKALKRVFFHGEVSVDRDFRKKLNNVSEYV